jgi:hypothetical protein
MAGYVIVNSEPLFPGSQEAGEEFWIPLRVSVAILMVSHHTKFHVKLRWRPSSGKSKDS